MSANCASESQKDSQNAQYDRVPRDDPDQRRRTGERIPQEEARKTIEAGP